MGWVMMSERELNRVEVLSQIDDGRLTVENGANMLGLTRRQVFRLLKRYRVDGAAAIRHRARGRPPNNRISETRRRYALDLVRERYSDFGPTLAAESLAERHGLTVSAETLRKWMIADGLWLPRSSAGRSTSRACAASAAANRSRSRPGLHAAGLRRRRDQPADAAALRAVGEHLAYFEALELYLRSHGRPVAFHSDKHSVFRVQTEAAKTGHGMTQFGRALNALNVEILCANTSQAKGRLERANRTFQDRLVKALRLAGISDIAAANAFLPGFMDRYNARFAKTPRRAAPTCSTTLSASTIRHDATRSWAI